MGIWSKIDGDRLELGGPVTAPGPGGWSLMRRPDGIAWLVLDAPGLSTNRIDAETLAALNDILAGLEAEPPKGLVLRSAKRSGFMVGADIAQFRGVNDADLMAMELAKLHAVFDRLEALPFPTVAVVHGHTLGGGLELALACRYRVALSSAQLGFPEVQLGLHPGLGGPPAGRVQPGLTHDEPGVLQPPLAFKTADDSLKSLRLRGIGREHLREQLE